MAFGRPEREEVRLKFVEKYLDDPTLSFFLDDEPVGAEALAAPISLPLGDHLLEIKRGLLLIKQFVFHVGEGTTSVDEPADEYPPAIPPAEPPHVLAEVPPPLVHFTFDGDADQAFQDVTGNTQPAHKQGAVGRTQGVLGQAATFLENDALSIPDQPSFHARTAVTLSAWACPSASGGKGGWIVGKWLGQDMYQLSWNANGYDFGVAFPGGPFGVGARISSWGLLIHAVLVRPARRMTSAVGNVRSHSSS